MAWSYFLCTHSSSFLSCQPSSILPELLSIFSSLNSCVSKIAFCLRSTFRHLFFSSSFDSSPLFVWCFYGDKIASVEREKDGMCDQNMWCAIKLLLFQLIQHFSLWFAKKTFSSDPPIYFRSCLSCSCLQIPDTLDFGWRIRLKWDWKWWESDRG